MSILRWLWNPEHFWTIWLWVLVAGGFAIREFWALGHKRPQDTFSWWVWRHLKLHVGESMGQWSFWDFFFFVIVTGLFIFLVGHFFWHKWAGG